MRSSSRHFAGGCFPVGAESRDGEKLIAVVDDLPPIVPVTNAEIDAVARYCRDLFSSLILASAATETTRGPLPAGLDGQTGGT